MTTQNGSEGYDAIVVGAGHNGLITANYLAREGKKVLVLEARDVVGGACTTEELIPGSRWSSCAFIAGLLRPEIIAELELEKFGLEMYNNDAMEVSIFEDGSHMFMWSDIDKTVRELAKYSRKDAKSFLDFGLRIKKFASLITPFLMQPPPSRSEVLRVFEEAGEEDLFNEFVLQSTKSLLDHYFESEHIKGLLTFFGVVSVWGGPSTPGTGYVYGHHSWGEFQGQMGKWGLVRGGMGGVTTSLAAAAEHHGATVRLNAYVDEVIVSRGKTTGVRLSSGEVMSAPVVISNADPQRSMLTMLPKGTLKPALTKSLEQYDVRGTMARVHLLIDELPQYIGFEPGEGPQHRAQAIMGASVENFELAAEAQRRGVLVDDFVIEAMIQSVTDDSLAPPGFHTMTLGVNQLPFELAGRTWDDAREEFADRILESLYKYAPNLRNHIVERVVITPLDLEREYLLTGGNIFHGAMFLEQLFGNRPVPELADYRTPVDGYYLCGSGTHPGGGVMGASGHNAAKVVLDDLAGRTTTRTRDSQDGRGRRSFAETVMSTKAGKELGFQVARSSTLRPVTRRFTKSGD